MTSAIPYDPSEFEDNNPFAEPIEHHAPVLPQDSAEPVDEEPEEHTTENQVESQDNQADADVEGKLTQEELRKLVPERFTKKYLMSIKLTGVEKNRMSNPILKFDVEVQNLPKYRQSTYKEVRRTFQEVQKFNKYLTVSNLECFVPQLPSCTTSYPAGGEEETKQLSILWQEWFDRITSNPIIIRDDEFVYFVENDFGYSVINSNRKTSVASGLIRKTLKQLPVPYDSYSDLADFRPLIKACYVSCQKLEKLLEKNSKVEKQLATSLGELSQKISQLSLVEIIHPGMKNMWEKLSKIKLIEADLVLIQLYNDMGILGDGIRIMTEDFYQVKEALTNRHLIMRELIQAKQQTEAKHLHANKIKNKSSLDPIKADEALRALEYATKAEESLTLQVKRISGEMMIEKDEVINHTELKFHKLLKQYTLNKVDHHRKILKHLENIRLDIRLVDDKGGLSRLNRENLGNFKHNLIQSQSATGDSWSSRTFRSLKEEEDLKKKQQEQELNDKDKLNTENEDLIVDAKNAAHLLGVATF